MKTLFPKLSRLRLAGMAVALGAGLYASVALALQFSDLDAQPLGYVSPVEFSSFDLASGKAVIFRGDYVRATWEGDLVAEKLLNDGSVEATKWNARLRLLPTPTSWDTGRKIFTRNASGVAVPFRTNKDSVGPVISKAQRDALASNDDGRNKVLNYLRGDATNEYTPENTAGEYRYRFSKLGAVIHSRPYYYDHGKDASGKTVARVYVGANDGMLHAFDAETGDEVFAYVPSMLFPKLKFLAANTNPPPYNYYVDGSIAIGKVPQASGGERTILVGGLGGGGNGLYALDITEPTPSAENATVAAALVKWEITGEQDPYRDWLGHVYGAPQFVRLNDAARTTVLLVPNGVNSSQAKPKLYVINPLTGAKLHEFTAGSLNNNGLGAIAPVDYDGNGTVDAVYAGDQRGTMWKFDLSATSLGALPAAGTVLYTPPSTTLRPITAAPSVIAHPSGGYLVNFGTGRTMEPDDQTSTLNEYLYGIWDGAPVNNNQIIDQTLTSRTVSLQSGDVAVRTASTNDVKYGNNARGWRIALTGGERLIGADTLTDSGRYVITTAIPSGSNQGGWLLQVNALTGSGPNLPFFDLDGDDKVSADTDRVAVVNVTNGKTELVAPVGKSLGAGVWSQPVFAQRNSTQDYPYFNYNANVMVPATTTGTATTAAPVQTGVWGGHFDLDIYYNCSFASTGYPCSNNTHTHAYDDKHNVVGVNLLNASNPAYNLDKPMPSVSAPRFKILLGNTRWSPAATVSVSGNSTSGGVSKTVTLQEYGWQFPLSPGGFLSDVTNGAPLTFSRADVSKLMISLTKDSFNAKEWIPGSGDVRAGLLPSATGCVRGNHKGGINEGGAWMNGAFVLQLVKDTTPDSAIGPAFPTDAGGFLLKKDTTSQAYQVVQYTMFWHNGACYGQPNWTKAPPPDTRSSNRPSTPPPGTADPTGNFVYSGGSTATTGKRAVTTTETKYRHTDGVEYVVTVSRDYADSGFRQVIRRKSDGMVLNDTVSGRGETQQAPLQQGPRPRMGRLAWTELLR